MREKRYSLIQNTIFNTVGIFVYYLSYFALSMAIVRLSTDENIGHFQLSLTITNTFTSIANYSMRTYQISDIRDQFLSGHYVAVRLFTSSLAFLLCVGYSMLWNYSISVVLCIALYMIYRLNESIAEVFHAVDQKNARMDHVLISYAVRGILMLVFFVAAIAITDNLFIAVSGMILATYAVILFYDIPSAGLYDNVLPLFERKKMWGILKACFPTMIGAVCFTSIVTVPRQYLADILGQDILGYYASVATPLVFIQVLVNALLSPAISEIAVAKEEKNFKRFWGLSGKMLLIILGVGVVSLSGVLIWGRPIMQLFYGEKILPYVSLMYPVVGCTVFYAICVVGYNLLIVLRRMKTYLLICASAFAVAVLTSKPMIFQYGANGVSFAVIIAYLIAAIAFLGVIFFATKKWISRETSL